MFSLKDLLLFVLEQDRFYTSFCNIIFEISRGNATFLKILISIFLLNSYQSLVNLIVFFL